MVFDQRLKFAVDKAAVSKALRGLLLTLKAIDIATEATRESEPATLSARLVREAMAAVMSRGLDMQAVQRDVEAVADIVAAHL